MKRGRGEYKRCCGKTPQIFFKIFKKMFDRESSRAYIADNDNRYQYDYESYSRITAYIFKTYMIVRFEHKGP